MATLATDNFIRASYPVNLTATGLWTGTSGGNTLTVASAGTVQPSSTLVGCDALYSAISWPNDQFSSLTLGQAVADSYYYLWVRSTLDGANGYFMLMYEGGFNVYKYVSSVPTQIYTQAVGPAAGDVWSLSVIGTTFTVLKNYRYVAQFTDSTFAGGYPGFGLYNLTAPASNTSAIAWAGGSGIPLSVVSSGSNQNWNGSATNSISTSAFFTPANSLIVVVGNDLSVTMAPPTDTAGNTYVLGAGSSGNNVFWYSTTGKASASNVVNVNALGATYVYIGAVCISGADLKNPLDTTTVTPYGSQTAQTIFCPTFNSKYAERDLHLLVWLIHRNRGSRERIHSPH